MKRIMAALIVGFLCVSSAWASVPSPSQMCEEMSGLVKIQAMVSRDALKITKKEYILDRQRSVMDAEDIADEKKIPLLKIYSLWGELIWDRYEMMIPELLQVQFATDCKKEGWDFAAFY